MGKQRLGVNLISLITALGEEARLPGRVIQWCLDTVHGLRLSLGAIVEVTGKVARKAQTALAGILEHVGSSPVVHAPVVHADEIGWREDGHNGYVRTFSTPTQRYIPRGTSCGGVPARPWWMKSRGTSLLACWSATSTPPTTTTTAPNNAAGHTCCGTSTTCAHSTPMLKQSWINQKTQQQDEHIGRKRNRSDFNMLLKYSH